MTSWVCGDRRQEESQVSLWFGPDDWEQVGIVSEWGNLVKEEAEGKGRLVLTLFT